MGAYQVTTLFNSSLLPARPRDFHGHGPKPGWTMPNDRFEDTMHGTFKPGDHLVESMLLVVTDQETPLLAAGRAWHLLNIDERMNGSYERSMSVGDFVCVAPLFGDDAAREGATVWYRCAPIGFDRCNDPTGAAEFERYEGERVMAKS